VAAVDDAPGRYDVGLDSVGGRTTAAVLRKLHGHGLLVWFGQAGRTEARLDFLDWTGGESATIRKFSYADSDVGDGEDLATLVRLVAQDRLHPEIGLTADWSETGRVIRALLDRRVRGNAVLTVCAA
jgi:NADPH:quinone reductase-like Zn-dependent oxidoreductase